MPVCYIYRQQEGRQAELPKGRRDFKMATLDVTEKVNVLVDAIGWESFCEELMERMDEDALDAVCDRIAPRYGVELAGSPMQPKDTEERRRAIDRVNRAYADEDYDRYERLIERYCHRFGFDGDYGLFEDACTDARIFGHGIG